MGMASRKMKKKREQQADAGRQAEGRSLERKLAEEIENEAYAEALDTLAELVRNQTVAPQSMYEGAYAYFMLGDYERAATWIDHTLRFAPQHVSARILLARLCILQERVDDGLAIFELLTDKFLPGMTEEEKDEIESIAGFYGRNEPEKLLRERPHLAAFLHIGEDEEDGGEAEPADGAPETGRSALDLLRGLKAKLDERMKGRAADDTDEAARTDGQADAAEPERGLSVPAEEPADAEAARGEAAETEQSGAAEPELPPADAADHAEAPPAEAEAVGEPPDAADGAEEEAAADESSAGGTAAEAAPADEAEAPFADEADEEALNEAAADEEAADEETPSAPDNALRGEAEARLCEILAKKAAISEKLRLLNAFAGGYYAAGAPGVAEMFLMEAVRLDDADDGILRNLALLLAEKGEKKKAVSIAARMARTDFLLLRAIREA